MPEANAIGPGKRTKRRLRASIPANRIRRPIPRLLHQTDEAGVADIGTVAGGPVAYQKRIRPEMVEIVCRNIDVPRGGSVRLPVAPVESPEIGVDGMEKRTITYIGRGIECAAGGVTQYAVLSILLGAMLPATVSGHAHREEDIGPGAARIETSRRIEDETAAHALVRVARIVTGIAVHVRQVQRSLGRSIVVEHAERKLAVLLQRLEIRQFSDMALPAADGLRHVAEALRTARLARYPGLPGDRIPGSRQPRTRGSQPERSRGMVGKPVELVVDGVNGLVDIAVAEERTLLAGRGGLVILIFQVECVPFGRSGHPDGGIALTHEDVVVARQVVIADQDDAAPALIFADRTGGLTGKADFGPGRSLHRAAQHAVELDPLLADLDLGLPGTFGKSPPRRRFAPPARRGSDASAAKRRSTPFTGRDSVKATKKKFQCFCP